MLLSKRIRCIKQCRGKDGHDWAMLLGVKVVVVLEGVGIGGGGSWGGT